MARIQTYPNDIYVTGNDKWIGSDFNNDFITKNFTANAVADYFNRVGIIDTGSFNWTYKMYDEFGPQPAKTFELVGHPFDTVDVIGLAGTIKVSFLTLANTEPGVYIEQVWLDKIILVNRPGFPSEYGLYKVTAVVQSGDFYFLDLDFIGGHSGIVNEDEPVTFGLFSGVSGTSGTTGTSGTSGSSGSSGSSGIDGTSGSSGTTGTSGSSGTTGTSGSSGTDGTSGTSGTRGTSGTSGTDGTGGTSGTRGTSGTSGIDGIDGTDGTSGTSGTDGTGGTSGTTGTSGTSGIDGTSGSGGTSGTSGVNGTSGTGGTSGTDGTGGTSGTDGTGGTSGTSGSSGSSGIDGTSGTAGTSGSSGTDGTGGTSGTDGTGGTSGTSGTAGTSGTTGTSGTGGIDGTSGTSGENGVSNNLFLYQAHTTSQTGYPGNGHILWNNTTQISATQINISHLTNNGIDIDIFLALLQDLQQITIQDQNSSANYQIWDVNGTPTQVTGANNYWIVPVTLISSAGTGTTNFANNHDIFLAIVSQSGTSGVDGTSGTSGTTGTSGTGGTSGVSGSSGTSGANGTSGVSGSSGSSGSSGVNGTSGVDGTSGSSGVSGTSGSSGASGTSGVSGTSGINGTSGVNGTSGLNGSSGTSGANGTSGTSGTTPVGQITGTLTAGKIPKATGTNTLGNSIITEASSAITVSGAAVDNYVASFLNTDTGGASNGIYVKSNGPAFVCEPISMVGGITLNSSGSASFSGDITANKHIKIGGTSSQFLMADGSTSTGPAGGITGSLTTNYIPRATGTTTIANSAITDDGTTIILGRATSTLAAATESNAITITQPTFTTDQPVKLLNFNWYDEPWSIGNVRSASTPSSGLGIFATGVEKFRFKTNTFLLAAGVNLQFGDNPYIRWSSNFLNLKNTDNSIPVVALRANGGNTQAPRLDMYNAADDTVIISLNSALGTGSFYTSLTTQDYRYTGNGYLTYNTSGGGSATFTLRNNGTTVLGFNSSNAAAFASTVSAISNITISSTGNASLTAATNSTAGFTYIDLINNGASGKNYQIGIAGNSAASGYANNLYIDLVGSGNIITLASSRNVLIGTQTDSGYKLDVNGNGRFIGSLTITSAGTERYIQLLGYNSAYTTIRSNVGYNSSYNNTSILTNVNSNESGQGNASIPSWLINIGGNETEADTFAIKRSPAGSFTFSNRFILTAAGAATFSSSVTATGNIKTFRTTGSGTYLQMNAESGVGTFESSNGYYYFNRTPGDYTSPNLMIDGANNRVGIGTASPGVKLTVSGGSIQNIISTSASSHIQLANSSGSTYFGNDANGGYLYTDWNSPFLFYTNGAEKMRLTSGGNVLIGLTSSTYETVNRTVIVANGTTTALYGLVVNGVNKGYFYSTGTHILLMSEDSSGYMSFGTANSERARITSGGNVLIGTTTDNGFKLQVNGGASVAGQLNVNAGTGNSAFFYGDAGFDGSNRVYITNNAYIYGRNNLVLTGRLDASNDGYSFGTNSRNSLVFSVNEGGAQGSVGTEYYGIQLQLVTKALYFQSKYGNDNGLNGILFSSDNQFRIRNVNSYGNYALQVTGDSYMSGSITATSFFESSDKTLKTLIEDNYQAKGIESVTAKLYTKNGKEELGYFAQDVQGILPSAVSKGEDGLLSLSYREVLVAKVQRTETEIDKLKRRVAELEQQLNLK